MTPGDVCGQMAWAWGMGEAGICHMSAIFYLKYQGVLTETPSCSVYHTGLFHACVSPLSRAHTPGNFHRHLFSSVSQRLYLPDP